MLGRRLTDSSGAYVAALLFALHPASHEAVYWMAARFDLLATCFSLLAILLPPSRRQTLAIPPARRVLPGRCCRRSRRSPVLLIAPAHDVLVAPAAIGARRSAGCCRCSASPPGTRVLRSQSASLAAAGGAGKLPKLLMLAAGLAALSGWRDGAGDGRSATARRRAGRLPAAQPWRAARPQCRCWPSRPRSLCSAWRAVPTSAWTREKLGFVAYAAFYLVSPVVLPGAPARDLRAAVSRLRAGRVPVGPCGAGLLRAGAAWLQRVPAGAFLCCVHRGRAAARLVDDRRHSLPLSRQCRRGLARRRRGAHLASARAAAAESRCLSSSCSSRGRRSSRPPRIGAGRQR